MRFLPQGTHLQYKLEEDADAKQHRRVDSSDCQQPRQALSSRPATPEHPEQQLCTTKPPSRKGSAAAAGASGSDQATPASVSDAAQASRIKPSGEHTGGYGADVSTLVSGSQDAMPGHESTAVRATASKAGVLQAGANASGPRNPLARAGVVRDASKHRRQQGAKRSPPAVSWDIEVSESRTPAPGHPAHAERQRIAGGCPMLPTQPNSHNTGHDPIGRSH